ncbi:MAG TPA: hypothetical protein PLM75_03345 [bacterium]|nr:hypothetical protein [bacterium]
MKEKIEFFFDNYNYEFLLKETILIVGHQKFLNFAIKSIKTQLSNDWTKSNNLFFIAQVDKNAVMLSNMNIQQNMILPLLFHKNYNETESQKIINDLAELFDLKIYVNVFPESLNIQQKKKYSIIRALSLQPQIIIIDECSTFEQSEFLEICKKINDMGIVVIATTEILTLADYYKNIIIINEKICSH